MVIQSTGYMPNIWHSVSSAKVQRCHISLSDYVGELLLSVIHLSK